VALTTRIGYVDLSTGKVRAEPITPDDRRRFLGGRGFNIKLLLDSSINKAAVPLSPENVIVVSTGLLAGMLAPGANRTIIGSKSPLSGCLAGANIGGFFAPELRQAGFEHLVVSGKARKPSFILIQDGKIRIRDASSLWGHTVQDTQEILRKEIEDDEVQMLCIGPAGERQVNFASVATRDMIENGQSGMGAVFGSKNLKAIVARGHGGIPIACAKDALRFDREVQDGIASSGLGCQMLTSGVSSLEGRDEDIFKDHTTGWDGCFGCQLHCRRRYAIARGEHAGAFGSGPAYLSTQAWSDVLGEDRPETILYADHLTNSYGLDALETAGVIAWAIRLYEEGIITSEDTDGIQLQRGDASSVEGLIAMMAKREGLGDLLAAGSAKAADKIGKASALYLRETAGLSSAFGAGEPTPWQGLGVSTSNRGLDTLRFRPASDPCRLPETVMEETMNKPVPYTGVLSSNPWDYSSAPWLVRWTETSGMAVDMLGICDFQSVLFGPELPGFDEFSEMVRLNAGLDISSKDIWQAAERALNAERLFNISQGYDPRREHLRNWHPGRAKLDYDFGPVLDEGEFDLALAHYYRMLGWDVYGVPRAQDLKGPGVEPLPGGIPGR
jgi:aldehyde:ferredoxin oxidoreductase